MPGSFHDVFFPNKINTAKGQEFSDVVEILD
jgi:hypothetical protein